MEKKDIWKWLILVTVTMLSMALVWPTDSAKPWYQKIPLGLDLQGGTSFTAQIDEKEIERQIRESDEG